MRTRIEGAWTFLRARRRMALPRSSVLSHCRPRSGPSVRGVSPCAGLNHGHSTRPGRRYGDPRRRAIAPRAAVRDHAIDAGQSPAGTAKPVRRQTLFSHRGSPPPIATIRRGSPNCRSGFGARAAFGCVAFAFCETHSAHPSDGQTPTAPRSRLYRPVEVLRAARGSIGMRRWRCRVPIDEPPGDPSLSISVRFAGVTICGEGARESEVPEHRCATKGW